MDSRISESEARLALDAVERRRQQVAAEINVPGWYWGSLAVGWVGLSVLTTYGPVWATTVATLAFGAAHSAVAPRVISGRRGSSQLSIRQDLVSKRVPALVLGFLVVMTILTVGIALVLDADGARHPAILAGVIVAALVLTGGPALMSWVRGRAVRRLAA
jgi:branched-subunit amino acid transport protein AzlD